MVLGQCIQRSGKMKSNDDISNNPVMSAAKRALETGEAQHILIWVPEESANTLKNLLERACCERTIRKDAHDRTAADWYFETVNRLHSRYYGPHNLSISTKPVDEKR
jgi:hypothetical protein